MGLLDDIISQQSGGGMLGGLPATWQYANPESLSPTEKQMMAMVGTQNPDKAGFAPLPASTGAFPVNGTAPITGLGADTGQAAPTIGAPPPANMSAFNTGATPALFVNPPGATPGNPMMPPPASAPIAASDDGEDDAPTAAPAAPVAIGNYQMPRIGSVESYMPDPASLPGNAQPTQGRRQAVEPSAEPGIGDKLMTGFQNFQSGHNIVGSIVAAITGRRNDPAGIAQQQQTQIANLTARALVNKGIAPELAIAAVQPGNSEFLKTLVTQAFGPKTVQALGDGYIADKDGNVRRAYTPEQKDKFQVVQRGEDEMGRKTFVKINQATGEEVPWTTPSGAESAQPMIGDMSKSGDEYLGTIPDKHRSIVKGMVDGTIQPPTSFAASKPYWQNMVAAAKHYDPTFDENSWNARRKMAIDLASSSNSSMGGILSNGGSAFKHLAEYTKSAAEQGNVSHNYPMGGMVAHAQNWIGNKTGGSDTEGKIKALKDNLSHYGQESTKFYAGTGGGVEERMHALKEMDPVTASGEEAAAYAEKEKSLMVDRLYSKLQEIRHTYGEEQGNRIIAKHLPEIEKTIATIDANIARLRGDAPAASVEPPTLKVGETANIGNGVTIKKVSDK